MPRMDPEIQQTAARFLDAASRVWTRYQEVGPGAVREDLFADVDELAKVVSAAVGDADLVEVVAALRGLCERCCCRSEGLCFITGEAGLVPRRDLHEQFEQSLQRLRDAIT